MHEFCLGEDDTCRHRGIEAVAAERCAQLIDGRRHVMGIVRLERERRLGSRGIQCAVQEGGSLMIADLHEQSEHGTLGRG